MKSQLLNDIEFTEAGANRTSTPPIICLHGIGGSYESFTPQLDALAKHQRIIAWNMPGYGRSALLPDTCFEALTQSLLKLMDSLEIATAHLIGHSIGGMIAQELALTHPQRVTSLALLATTAAFGGKDDSFKQKFLAARLKPLDNGVSMAQLATQFVPGIVGKTADPAVITAAIRTMSQVPEQTYRAILECLVRFDRYQDTAKLDMPACLIVGENDVAAPAATLQKMAGKMPDARFHVLEGVGHLVNLEAADRCNQILSAFFNHLHLIGHHGQITGSSSSKTR